MITSLKVGTKVILRDIVYVVPGVRLTVTFFSKSAAMAELCVLLRAISVG